MVGLGNPGAEYARTRHNAGFVFVKQLARECGVKFNRKKQVAYAEVKNKFPEGVILALPRTYMNRSGSAVAWLAEKFKAGNEDIVIVVDDFDLALGDVRIRERGSAGSHKGLQSVIQELGTKEFPRIRIGIGPLPENEDAAGFVLSSFPKTEQILFKDGLRKAWQALDLVLSGDTGAAMNKFNKPGLFTGRDGRN
ncbi:MAG: aminoacyl-tRNA hydrolase [Candidatus Aminicenantes bacterium]